MDTHLLPQAQKVRLNLTKRERVKGIRSLPFQPSLGTLEVWGHNPSDKLYEHLVPRSGVPQKPWGGVGYGIPQYVYPTVKCYGVCLWPAHPPVCDKYSLDNVYNVRAVKLSDR